MRQSPLPLSGDRESKIFPFFSSDVVNVEKEVLIFDMGALTSALGGYLGLFLGLSCFSISDWVVAKAMKKCEQI